MLSPSPSMIQTLCVIGVCLLIASRGPSQTLTQSDTSIDIAARAYHLHIHKSDAQCLLTDALGKTLCTFPLWADASPTTLHQNVIFDWTVVDTTVSYLATDVGGAPHVKCTMVCGGDAFSAEFAVHYPDTAIFSRYRQGLDVMSTYAPLNTGNPPFSIAGQKYSTGIWTHAVSTIHVPIPAHAVTFESDFGKEDSENFPSNVQCAISIDGDERVRSGIMTLGDSARHLRVNVAGGKILTLSVFDGGDSTDHDHVDWAAPVFIMDSGPAIDAPAWVATTLEGIHYFSLNGAGVNFPQGFASIWNATPDCEESILSYTADVGARASWCGYEFNPGPTLFSFQSSRSNVWMGLGITALPNAGWLRFDNDHLDLPTFFTRMSGPHSYWYALPGVCFVFDSNRAANDEHYFDFLASHGCITETDSLFYHHPAWWDNLAVCPWGDQDYRLFTLQIPTTQSWVEDYLSRAEQLYADSSFTFIIDDQWRKWRGDASVNTDVYSNLRALIDTAHRRGHHVTLQWPFWTVSDSSLPVRMGISQTHGQNDWPIIDATHPLFETYADSVLHMVLDSAGLNADGLKMDFLSRLRNPGLADYANAADGMGMQEQLHAAKKWTAIAKRIKPDCLLTYTIANPFFNSVVDKVRLNDNLNPWSHFQLRARTVSQVMPHAFIDSDGWHMKHEDMEPYYFGACVFGTPAVYYMDHYRDIPRVDSTETLLAKLFTLYRFKQFGQAQFKEDDGSWLCIRHDTVMAESVDSNAIFIVRCSDDSSKIISRASGIFPVPLHHHAVLSIVSEDGQAVAHFPGQDTVWCQLQRGVVYTMHSDPALGVVEAMPVRTTLIFPNPALTQFTIATSSPVDQLAVFNSLGVAMVRVENVGNMQSNVILSTETFPPGMYIVQLHSRSGDQHVKLVVVTH